MWPRTSTWRQEHLAYALVHYGRTHPLVMVIPYLQQCMAQGCINESVMLFLYYKSLTPFPSGERNQTKWSQDEALQLSQGKPISAKPRQAIYSWAKASHFKASQGKVNLKQAKAVNYKLGKAVKYSRAKAKPISTEPRQGQM